MLTGGDEVELQYYRTAARGRLASGTDESHKQWPARRVGGRVRDVIDGVKRWQST